MKTRGEKHECPFCDEEIAEASFPWCRTCKVKVVCCTNCGKTFSEEVEKCPECGANIAPKAPGAEQS